MTCVCSCLSVTFCAESTGLSAADEELPELIDSDEELQVGHLCRLQPLWTRVEAACPLTAVEPQKIISCIQLWNASCLKHDCKGRLGTAWQAASAIVGKARSGASGVGASS